MSEMVPGLHPHTRPQRKGKDGAWATASGDAFEPRDAPPRWVAAGIIGLLTMLVLSVAAVLWFVSDANPYCSGQKLNIDGAGQASFR